MTVACEHIAPGMRQCDLVAKVLSAQVSGVAGLGGDTTALCPLMMRLTLPACSPPDVDRRLSRPIRRWRWNLAAPAGDNAGLARTVQLGKGPQKVFDTAKAVTEGLEAVLQTIRPGIGAGDVHRAWQAVLDRYGLNKESRIGYSIGN